MEYSIQISIIKIGESIMYFVFLRIVLYIVFLLLKRVFSIVTNVYSVNVPI